MVIECIFAVYTAIIIVLGSATNILCSVTCFSIQLRQNASFLFIGAISIVDSIYLLLMLFNLTATYVIKFQTLAINFLSIKIWFYMVVTFDELSSILQVNIRITVRFNYLFTNSIYIFKR